MEPAPAPPARWGLVGLLFLATLLNYMDRQALAQTSPYLLAEFGVPPGEQETVYGRVEFAFGVAFAGGQLVAGFLADRVSLRWLYLGAILVWSAAGGLTGLVPAGALGALLACRVLLGAGEAFNWPCAVAAVRRVVPRTGRGLANGVFHSGASAGAIATPLLVLLVAPDWRAVFVGVGAGGLVWAGLWLVATRGAAGRAVDARPEPAADLPFRAVFGLRTFWVMMAVGCSVNLGWHFFRVWFVRYLAKDLHRPADELQWLPLGFFVAADLGSVLSGFTIRRLTRAGLTVERSRKWVMTGLAGACLMVIPATRVGPLAVQIGLFYLVAAGAMGGYAVYFSLAQDIAAGHTAKLVGASGAAAWGLIAVANGLTGRAADATGTFVPLLVAAGFVPLAAAAAGWLWPEPRPPA